MEKKDLKKNSEKWVCPEGCEQTKNACPHLEKLIPHMSTGKFKPMTAHAGRAINVVDELKEEFNVPEPEYRQQVARFEAALIKWGLAPWRVELVIDRFIDRLTLEEIAKQRGWLNRWQIKTELERTTEILKSFGVEKIREVLKGGMSDE